MTPQTAGMLVLAWFLGGALTFAGCLASMSSTKPNAPDVAYFTFVALWPITVPVFVLRLLWIGGVYLVKHI